MILKYVVAWVPMVLIAVVNGVLREAWYGKWLSELHAHQVSTASAVLLFGIYIWAVTHVWRPETSAQALAVGFMWLGLTVGFEFLFGHYLLGHSWNKLFRDYNIFAGRVWIAVLIWIPISPYVFYRLQK